MTRLADVPAGAPGQPVHFRDLAGLPLILPMNASLMTRQLRKIAAELEVRLHAVTQVTSVHIAKAMVLNEGGQTLLGYSSVHDEVQSGALAMRGRSSAQC